MLLLDEATALNTCIHVYSLLQTLMNVDQTLMAVRMTVKIQLAHFSVVVLNLVEVSRQWEQSVLVCIAREKKIQLAVMMTTTALFRY